MSRSDLQLTFSDIYTKVSEFYGAGSSPTGTTLTKIKDLTYRGYRRFLHPKNVRNGRAHVWSFLKKTATISTVSGEWEYPLPVDFNYFWFPPTYGADTQYPQLEPVTVRQIYDYRSSLTSSSYPQYWSLDTMEYDVSVGTRYKILIHPNPSGVYTFFFGYTFEPNKPTADGDYFIGGAYASECILECALAEVEANDDDMKTTHHNSRAIDMIQTCIEEDAKRKPPSVGSLNVAQNYWADAELARSLRWVDAATSAYGVS